MKMETPYNLDGYKFMVCTRCMTYNQEDYIEDAMNGFVMQKTNFPVVSIIVDDASTDNNATVIQRFLEKHFDIDDKINAFIEHNDYGDVWFARHKTNHNCFFAVILLKENHYGKKDKRPYMKRWLYDSKYLAFCEGDDFWIDPNKLQRQVDFLERNPNYELVFHNALLRFQNQPNQSDRIMRDFETGDFSTALIFEKWQLPHASVVCKNEIQDCKEMKKLLQICRGGFLYFIAASMRGKVYGISECWSVYRKNKGGVSTSFSPCFIQKVELGLAYATRDPATKKIIDTKAVKYLQKYLPDYFKKKKDAVELVKVTDSFNKKIFKQALRMYISHIPSKIWQKFKSLFSHK